MRKKGILLLAVAVLLFSVSTVFAASSSPTASPTVRLQTSTPVAASVGASMLRIESIQVNQSTSACQCNITVAIKNTGGAPFTGMVSWTTKFIRTVGAMPTGTNAFKITNLGPSQTHVVTKALTQGRDADCKQFSLDFYDETKSQAKLVDTKVVDLPGGFGLEVASAQVTGNSFVVTVRNTSNVAAQFAAQFFKSNSPNSWQDMGSMAFQCTGVGQSQTVSKAVPAGWPTGYTGLKAVIKSGRTSMAEAVVNAPAN